MSTTREQAVDSMTKAIQNEDTETAKLFFDYIAWLDSRTSADS